MKNVTGSDSLKLAVQIHINTSTTQASTYVKTVDIMLIWKIKIM